MFKKIQFGLLLSCVSAYSYAYVINANLTVENKTDVPMVIVVDNPNGQAQLTQPIPAHKTTLLHLENGDHSGWLYQASTAPFKIRGENANGKVYVQGRLAYYVESAAWTKYSFLNAVSAADNLTVATNYTCENGGYSTALDNQIIISGTPENELKEKKFPTDLICQGLKSSTFRDSNNFYTPTCSDGKTSVFWKTDDRMTTINGRNLWFHIYTNGEDRFSIGGLNKTEDSDLLQGELDRQIGNKYCKSKYL
jgi:hypothetical protein